MAFGLLAVWDFIYVFCVLRLGRELFPVAAGIAAITSMNFMSSDLVTVLISHGGAVGLLVVLVFVFLRNCSNNKILRVKN